MTAAAVPLPADPKLALGQLRARLGGVHGRIAQACRRAGRDTGSVRLLPVTKTMPAPVLRLAHAAGCEWFGENKVQEAEVKALALADLPVRWSIIGHLQTNKTARAARFADEFQALDNLRVAAALDRHLQALGRGLDVLVQVNTSGETSKFGLPPDAVRTFLRELPAFTSLRVRGLMTLAAFSAEAAQVRACFRRLRQLRDRLHEQTPAGMALDELSMGMSGDFELAIEEGATIVRVGQAIFGPRPTR
ncbi:MAG: YggS family pyridoxal phosphate-dependent enzyme [Gammaproteobacteria bacterium]|nr:YggS family pyridoxal phosphate-dependent enzyme [Gammaproteobacteria bacterium]